MDFRTLALGVGVFCATFLVGWWLNIGSLWHLGIGAARLRTAPAPADKPRRRPKKVAVQTPQSKAPAAESWQGPRMVQDKLMRDAVISWAQTYQRPTCDQDVRWGYTIAATKYAEALMRSAGCNNFPRCPMSEGQLERVWEANRSAADLPVAQAMAAAHAAGGLNERELPRRRRPRGARDRRTRFRPGTGARTARAPARAARGASGSGSAADRRQIR